MDNKLRNFIDKDDCFFIHYASDGFYNGSSPAPKISCIAIFSESLKVIRVFSINTYIQSHNIENSEKFLLKEFQSFLKVRQNVCFVHWNMNGEGFGFKALWARAKELGIKLPEIEEENLFDLSSYVAYLSEKRLSIKQILWFNSLLCGGNYLDGKTEAEYFNKGNFKDIDNSVKLKVQGFADVVKLIKEDKLKTEVPCKPNDGLTKEERCEQALKFAKAREKITEQYANNEPECVEEYSFLFFDFEHPWISLIANWVANM